MSTRPPRATLRRLAALALALPLALTACSGDSGSGSGAGDTTELSIAMQPWLGYGAWYIAQDQGIFADNGLNVTLKDFEADADMVAAFVAGDVDALNVATHTALRLASDDGLDLKIVLLEDASTAADAILTDGSVTSVAGLKGLRVAYEEGTTSDLLLNYALAEAGMSVADITKVPMGAGDAGAALIAGQVPVAVTYEPYITEAKAQNPAVTVLYEAGAKPGLISDVLVVRGELLAERPDAVKALLTSWDQAVQYYRANLDDGRAIIARGVGAEPEELVTAFDGVVFYDAAENKSMLTGDYATSVVPAVNEAARSAGLIQATVDPAAVIDASYVG
jgi:NitT/TauT family transport system substrate-binding protein